MSSSSNSSSGGGGGGGNNDNCVLSWPLTNKHVILGPTGSSTTTRGSGPQGPPGGTTTASATGTFV